MADDNSSAPARTGRPGNARQSCRPWLLLGGALAIGFAGIVLLFGQPLGVGYALAALLTAVIWVAVGFALGIRPSTGRADSDRVDPCSTARWWPSGPSAALLASERTHGHRAGAADGGDLPPRPPGGDEPDRLCHRARDERSGRWSTNPSCCSSATCPGSNARPASGAGWPRCCGAWRWRCRCCSSSGRCSPPPTRSLPTFLQGMFAWVQDYPQLLAVPDLEPDPELAGARAGAAAFTARNDSAGAGGLR